MKVLLAVKGDGGNWMGIDLMGEMVASYDTSRYERKQLNS
jgi:hypothetical protein